MEMPKAENKPNPEVTSSSMHDIPLSNDEHEQQGATGAINKIPSKSSSLKRFFKVGSNKKAPTDGSNENLDHASDDGDTEEVNEEVPVKIEQVRADNQDEIKRSRSRRFNFRFHGNTAENDTPTSSANASSASRHSLRGSLSTYISSVFKRKQGATSKHALRSAKKRDAKTDEEKEPSQEVVQHEVTEDSEKCDIENQTVEVIDELETMTISEQQQKTGAASIPLAQE